MQLIINVYNTLLNTYGYQGWWPLLKKNDNGNYYSDYSMDNTTKTLSKHEMLEISVGAILTQNTTWKNAEKALINLACDNYLSINKLKEIDPVLLAELIKPSGYYNQKSKKIKSFINYIDKNEKISRENLLNVWGLGPETCDDILLYAYNIPTFVIDAYTIRFLSRLGFCSEQVKYDELKCFIEKNIPTNLETYKLFHALIVFHSKERCKKKPSCIDCPFTLKCKHFNQSPQ